MYVGYTIPSGGLYISVRRRLLVLIQNLFSASVDTTVLNLKHESHMQADEEEPGAVLPA